MWRANRTQEQAEEATSRVNLRKLGAGELACAGCGIGIRSTVIEQVSTSFGTVIVTTLSRCSVCSDRVHSAEELAQAHPAVVGRLGSIEYAISVIEASLGALDALAFSPTESLEMVRSDRLLRLATQYLPRAGSAARWSARFAPTIVFGADPEAASVARWSHLSEKELNDLRTAFASFLKARIDGPVAVRPPADGAAGCLLCGLGSLTVMRSQANNAWGSICQAETHTLGGRPRPEPAVGYLCPVCRRAAEGVGSLGPTAAEVALIDYLGVRMRIEGVQLPLFRAWIGLPEGSSSNETPWAHIADLSRLRARLELANRGPFRDKP